jgi:hypothetical protein
MPPPERHSLPGRDPTDFRAECQSPQAHDISRIEAERLGGFEVENESRNLVGCSVDGKEPRNEWPSDQFCLPCMHLITKAFAGEPPSSRSLRAKPRAFASETHRLKESLIDSLA